MSKKRSFATNSLCAVVGTTLLTAALSSQAGPNEPAQTPLFVSQSVPPLNMLVMGRDHKLYYEAYNDASDLDGDGVLDVGFKPSITYYGYFNSAACYLFQNGRFEPTAAAGGNNTCSSAWSGNFLNYLATSRMDALRKVLYGGYRSTDSASETVLRAAFIPQDAHSSGKEFDPSRDGYDISQYTPLSTPPTGFRHLFAVTTLSDGGTPILRVLTNSQHRIWNWISKEGPVASDKCVDNNTNCTSSGSNNWNIVPAELFPNGLSITTWKDDDGSPSKESEMDNLFNKDSSRNLCGTGTVANINTSDSNNNPFTGSGKKDCKHDNYHTLITGTLQVPVTGNYQFAVNGDDAVDFFVGSGNDSANSFVGSNVANWYNGHGANSSQSELDKNSGSISLIGNSAYTIKFRHEEGSGGDSWQLYYKAPNAAASSLTDYSLNVLACPTNATLREANCKAYQDSNGTATYKPTGILHDFGENDSMKFALLTGSYAKNTKGGVLRSNIDSFTREVNSATGQFHTNVSDGIVSTLNNLRIIDFSYSNPAYQYKNCGWIGDVPITEKTDGMCTMWGNPLAEMMFEGLRYFAGATAGSGAYTYSSGARDTQSDLNLPAPAWKPPYAAKPNGGGEHSCAVPVMTVISDINPSYDFSLPGSRFNGENDSYDLPSKLSTLNVSTSTDAIGTAEGIDGKSFFIGQSTNNNADSSPKAKQIDALSWARGLSPEEPSKQGTFYSAGIAKFAAENTVGGDNKMLTYSIALASPLPQIRFPIGTGNNQSTITLVPFAKSVGSTADNNSYGIDARTNFQPTDQIVDYFVVKIANTGLADRDISVNDGRPYAQFRINYEDVEQGADHDMDAIALYTLSIEADGRLKVRIDSEYASGSIIQHMGYVISGTSADGIYLEVRDSDTPANNNSQHYRPYKLNTPPNRAPSWCESSANLSKSECKVLPLSAERTFTAASTAGAGFLKDPLWYAAKYGMPDRSPASVSGDPSNYFLVTNALTLKDQLANAFNDIMQRNNSVTSPAVKPSANTTASDSEFFVYRTDYDVKTWSGDLIKEEINTITGERSPQWKASTNLSSGGRNIKFASADGDSLLDFTWSNLQDRDYRGIDLQTALATDPKTGAIANGEQRLNFVKGSDTSFRKRNSLLGDIINSSPVLVEGAQYLTYLANSIEPAGNYAEFAATQEEERSPLIFVGANDGMLHAFDAESGNEVFAFVPSAVIPNLNKLTSPDYNEAGGEHHYYVDGTPVVRDVYFGGDWRTVLVGTLRAGGRSMFALDITDPNNIDLLWEFSEGDDIPEDAPENTASDMGYSFPAPTLARLHSGQWAVVTGNGYDSASGRAVLLLIDIETGDLIKKIPTLESDSANGLSSVRVADNNSDGIADYAYAGDLKGNLWRFDLIEAGSDNPFNPAGNISSNHFKVSFGGDPLFTALDSEGNAQAITAPPSLVRHPSMQGYIVMFGSGRYFQLTDKLSTDKVQTLYGIWDKQTKGESAASTPDLEKSDLQMQQFTEQAAASFQNGEESIAKTIRILSNNPITWHGEHASTGKYGWYLDLKVGSSLNGERVVDEMAARGQVLLFNTRAPSSDPCEAGLVGWTYGINPYTGGRTSFSVFDFNKNTIVGSDDTYGEDNAVVSGFETPAGGISLSGDTMFNTDGSAINVNFGSSVSGRQSWQIIPEAE